MRLRDLPRAVPLMGPLAVFLAGGLLGLGASYDLRLSVPWLAWLGAGATLYAVQVALARTPARLRLAAALPALAAAAAALCLAVQYRHLGFAAKLGAATWLGEIISAPFPSMGRARIDDAEASVFIEGGLPIAVGLALTARGWRRWTWAGCAALIAFGLLLTVSRGAWAALAAGAAAWGLIVWRWHGISPVVGGRWSVVLVAVAVAALSLAATPALAQALESAAFRAGDRLILYRNSFFLALEFPFTGIGPGGTFPMIYSSFQLLIGVPYLGYAHNLFLGAWLAQGLVGLVGLLALVLAAGRLIWRGLRTPGGDGCGPIRVGGAVGALALLLHGLTDAPQYDLNRAHLLPMCFAVLGVAVAAARLGDDRRPTNDERRTANDGTATDVVAEAATGRWSLVVGRWSSVGLVAAAAIALAGPQLAALGAANISAGLHARARLAPERGEAHRGALLDESLGWAERALGFDPRSPAALKRRGMLALDRGDYGTAVVALERARRGLPADQAVRKALGLAYVWYGLVDEGVPLLAALDDPSEMREELWVWSAAWTDRGRPELAERARRAALTLNVER
jgi:hypothetical protein